MLFQLLNQPLSAISSYSVGCRNLIAAGQVRPGELDQAMSVLPPRQRQVVTMREISGMSAEEVCAGLGISGPHHLVQYKHYGWRGHVAEIPHHSSRRT